MIFYRQHLKDIVFYEYLVWLRCLNEVYNVFELYHEFNDYELFK